jgi:hypothetical protein
LLLNQLSISLLILYWIKIVKNTGKYIIAFIVLFLYLVSATGIVITYTQCCCKVKGTITIDRPGKTCCCESSCDLSNSPLKQTGNSLKDQNRTASCGHKTVYLKNCGEYSNVSYDFSLKIKTPCLISTLQKTDDHILYLSDSPNKVLRPPPKPSGRKLLILLCSLKDCPVGA